MQPKLYEILQQQLVKGDVGIEIEVEGENLREVHNAFWKSEDDGSLRGEFPHQRCEYIFKKPQPYDKVGAIVGNLKKELEDAEFNFSHRTSCHVHVNVQELTLEQLLNMMYIYLLVEEPLINFCGRVRKGNQFALRLQDAEGILNHVQRLFERGAGVIEEIQQDEVRYAALNIAAVAKYGSLEFRGMRGTMDENIIIPWVETLINIRELAKAYENPQAVYNAYIATTPEQFLHRVTDQHYDLFVYPRMIKDIQRSFSLSIDLPFSYRKVDAKKKPSFDDYKIGQILAYEDAVVFSRIKGYAAGMLEQQNGVRKFKVVKLPEKPQPKKVRVPVAPVFNWDANPLVQVFNDEYQEGQ